MITPAGEFRERITLEKPYTPEIGEAMVWQSVATIKAAIWPIRAAEKLRAAEIKLDVTQRVRIRYREDLNHEWRIKWGTKTLNIDSIIEVERRRELELLCVESR